MNTPIKLSIVSAVYNAAAYLPDLFASVSKQHIEPGQVEFIFVVDGSPDNSAQVLRDWAQTTPHRVEVVEQENGGQASARNRGLALATGDWIAFTDPDDFWNESYLSDVLTAIRAHGDDIEIIATRPVIFWEKTRAFSHTHPRRATWRNGNVIRDLEWSPHDFPVGSSMNFYKLERIRALNLTFNERIRPQFEDGDFTCRYLLHSPTSNVYFLADAEYYYRKRADQSSTLASSQEDLSRFLVVPELGYLALLRHACELRGAAPMWLQSVVIYELSWYFSAQEPMGAPVPPFTDSDRETFVRLLADIRALIDDWTIDTWRIRGLRLPTLLTLKAGISGKPWVDSTAVARYNNRDRRFVEVSYFFTGERPSERILHDGVEVQPNFSKVIAHDYYGVTFLRERKFWVPATKDLLLIVDNTPMDISPRSRPALRRMVPTQRPLSSLDERLALRGMPTLRGFLGAAIKFAVLAPIRPRIARRRSIRQTLMTGVSILRSNMRPERDRRRQFRTTDPIPPLPQPKAHWRTRVSKYRHAWLVMDRADGALDSGEILFKHLRAEHPEINAWFVISEQAPDYQRLRQEGYGDRILTHESKSWLRAATHADFLASSHADIAVDARWQAGRRRARRLRRRMTYQFVFLQHGVIKDNIAKYLNPKLIDMFITSTKPEYDSIAGDDSTYRFSAKETVLTGLPRFDRLHRLAQASPLPQRQRILIAPTWRLWLQKIQRAEESLGDLRPDAPNPAITAFLETWQQAVNSPALKQLAQENGLTISALPHPNLLELPGLLQGFADHVEVFTYDDTDVQQLMAQARLFITDYSSIAFNAAYMGSPVLYYQFDAQKWHGGGHTGKADYFEYERDGFGPVAYDIGQFEDMIQQMRATRFESLAPYASRAAVFAYRDDRASERVVQEMLKVLEPAAAIPMRPAR